MNILHCPLGNTRGASQQVVEDKSVITERGDS